MRNTFFGFIALLVIGSSSVVFGQNTPFYDFLACHGRTDFTAEEKKIYVRNHIPEYVDAMYEEVQRMCQAIVREYDPQNIST